MHKIKNIKRYSLKRSNEQNKKKIDKNIQYKIVTY